jgi:hypothetical protein
MHAIAAAQFAHLETIVYVILNHAQQAAILLALEISNAVWELKYRPEASCNTHNHPPSQSPAVHPSHRHLSIEARNITEDLSLAGIQLQQTLTFMRHVDPTSLALPRDIYNQNASFRRRANPPLRP